MANVNLAIVVYACVCFLVLPSVETYGVFCFALGMLAAKPLSQLAEQLANV